MKKILVLFFIGSVTLIACQKKAAPTVSDRTEQPVPPAGTAAAVTYTAADIEAGKVVYETKCIKCHTAKPVGDFTQDRWTRILRSMIPKAKLNETESAQVTAYAMSNAKK